MSLNPFKARKGQPSPVRWRRVDSEHHTDLCPAWGISICHQETGFIWFVEVDEPEGLRIAKAGAAQTLTKAKKESVEAAWLCIRNESRPTPKHYGAKLKCLNCETIIQSRSVHHYAMCKCGAVAIDGGGEYCRMNYQKGAKWEQVTPGRYLIEYD